MIKAELLLTLIEGAFRLAEAHNLSVAQLLKEREQGTLTPERLEELHQEAVVAVDAIGEANDG